MRAIAVRCFALGRTFWGIDRKAWGRSSGRIAPPNVCLRRRLTREKREDAAMVHPVLGADGHSASVAPRTRLLGRERSDGVGADRWRGEPTWQQ